MCFHEAHWFYFALVMWTQCSSHFFTSFFIVLNRICLHAKVFNLIFVICSLLVGIYCVDWYINKLHCHEWKTHSFDLKCSPQDTENCTLGVWNFKIFWGLVDTVGYCTWIITRAFGLKALVFCSEWRSSHSRYCICFLSVNLIYTYTGPTHISVPRILSSWPTGCRV